MAKAKSKRAARKGPKSGKASTFSADPNVRLKKVAGTVHDLSDYVKVKTAAGNTSLSCGDEVAKRLQGKELDDVYKLASKTLDIPVAQLKARYGKLNAGMQRMNLGNRMRAA